MSLHEVEHTETDPQQQCPVDRLIGGLCSTIAAQRERIKELQEVVEALEALVTSRGDDAESYRLLAKQAIEALHREQVAHTRVCKRYERLIVEHRELLKRTSTLRRAA
jgi:hypothetical protein